MSAVFQTLSSEACLPCQRETTSANVERRVSFAVGGELDMVWFIVSSEYVLGVSVEASCEGVDVLSETSV